MMAVAFIAVAAGASFAQDACEDYDGQAALYEKFNAAYSSKDINVKKTSVDLGKQFLEKYGSCPSAEDTANWLKTNLPLIEKNIKTILEGIWLEERFAKFDNGVKTQKYADAYAAGAEILTKQPDNLNIIVPLGAIGIYESRNKNNQFNGDTVKYARMAIAKMNAGVTSEKYGVFQFQYDTKENALSEMNYAIAYMDYFFNGNQKAGVEGFYNVSQMPGKNKTNPVVFEPIGAYYFGEVAKLAEKVKTLIGEQQALTVEEEKIAKDKEIKSTIALLNAYAERSMDAYGRARALVTKSDEASQKYKDSLTAQMKTLYVIRFEKQDGLETYIASSIKKPMPDPAQPVEPVDADKTEEATGAASSEAVVTKTVPAAKPAPAAKAPASATAKAADTKATDAKTAKKPKRK